MTERRVAVLSMMETSTSTGDNGTEPWKLVQCEPRTGGGCEHYPSTTRSKNCSVNRKRAAAAMNNIGYEVENSQEQCEPRTGGGCEL
jgi:hypothetical protein